MRVRSLHLRNFRGHADTRLEVPDGVTALIGGNGAGKSSLLEGVAFALFGTEGLRTGKGLVKRDGAPPGDAVEATLELELGGQALTIHRELKGKALTPSASLLVDGALVVPAGAGSSEAVTNQLVRRLGMGAEAFFTTVVARQGELARLANESPADRKRMVLRMVGVDKVDAAIERARDKRRTAQANLEALRRVTQDPATVAARVRDAEAAVVLAQQRTATMQAAWMAAQASLTQSQALVQRLETEAEARRTAVLAAQAARREVAVATETAARAVEDAQFAAAARDAAAALGPLADRLPALQAQWLAAQHGLAMARQRVVQEQALARLAADLEAAVAAQHAIAAPPAGEDLEQAEVDLRMAEGEVVAAKARLATARTILTQAQQRRQRLQALGQDAPCPTCERPLGEHLQTMTAHTHDASARADDEAAAALAGEGQASQRLAAARLVHDRARDAQHRRERQALQAAAAAARVEVAQRALTDARSHLLPPTPAPAGIEALQADLGKAQRAHDDRQRHAGLAARLPDLQRAADAGLARRDAATLALAAATDRVASSPDPTPALLTARTAAQTATATERAAERAVHDALRGAATCEEAARHAQAAAEEQRRVATDVAAAAAEAQEWTALTDGHAGLLERFRDHVVDRIGPAVQAEASRLLSAFTGGRYTELLLDTSYDVYVTDGGVSYTLSRFSGGEQDLAHLALRLAVSRLVAERSGGAEVRFLALDEVFGSLDAQRRDLVVSALRGLGGLYSQVLVVSHQEALQEALDQAVVLGDGAIQASG